MQPWGRQREVERPKGQVSVASLPEAQQDAVMDQCEQASERYPAVELSTGQLLHVFEMGGDWEVWLNCEDANFTGICVAVGPTRQAVSAEAVRVFEAACDALQRPSL